MKLRCTDRPAIFFLVTLYLSMIFYSLGPAGERLHGAEGRLNVIH